MIDPTVGLIDIEKWMIKTHKENYWSSWIMKSKRGTLVGVVMCFNLELFIGWSINRYFYWSGSGARVETTAEDITVNRST